MGGGGFTEPLITYGIRIACVLQLPRVRFLARVKAVWWFSAQFRNIIQKESSGHVSADLPQPVWRVDFCAIPLEILHGCMFSWSSRKASFIIYMKSSEF